MTYASINPFLSSEGRWEPLTAGDVIITPPGETHGVENTGEQDFVYITVTTRPEDMSRYYAEAPGAAHD